jgi:hypothetical protein
VVGNLGKHRHHLYNIYICEHIAQYICVCICKYTFVDISTYIKHLQINIYIAEYGQLDNLITITSVACMIYVCGLVHYVYVYICLLLYI